MFIDAQAQFSSAQAVTAAAASTNLIDFGANRDMGTGEPIYVVLVVTTALTDSGSDSTVAVTFETDTTAAFGSATTAQTLFTVAATAAVGTGYFARLQPGAIVQQFGRLKYTPANGNLTTGSFTAFLTKDIQKYVTYATTANIS